MADRPSALDRPLVGFRAWRVTRRGLRCLNSEDVWPVPGVLDAQCNHPAPGLVAHLAPVPGCGCGAYAVDSVSTLCRYLDWHRGFRPWALRRGVVIGAVQLWGAPGRPVVVGELRGAPGLQYQAPRARVLAMAAHPDLVRLKLGGLPVVPLAGLELVAREIGGVQLRPPAAAPALGRTASAGGPRAWRVVSALGRFGWAALRWSVAGWGRRLALLAVAYVLAFRAYPAFVGLATAAGVLLALLVAWVYGWLRSLAALLLGR